VEFVQPKNHYAGKARWIVQILNDGWFEASIRGQHHALDKLRAIEMGLPMVRVSNNGCTSVLDKFGRVVMKVPENVRISKFFRLNIDSLESVAP
jgi:apolipoprotein N-acyltransferase